MHRRPALRPDLQSASWMFPRVVLDRTAESRSSGRHLRLLRAELEASNVPSEKFSMSTSAVSNSRTRAPSDAGGMIAPPLRSGVDHTGDAAVDVADRSGALRRRNGLGHELKGGRVSDRVERAILVEPDLRALDPGQDNGVLGVVLGAKERVHRAAGLVQVGARNLRLAGVLAVFPAALERVNLSRTGVVVGWQGATRRQGGQEDKLSVFGVQAQRLNVYAGGDSVLEQRDLVGVDGQKIVLRQSDQRQRGAALELRGRWHCGHVSFLSGCGVIIVLWGHTHLRIIDHMYVCRFLWDLSRRICGFR